MRQFDNCHDESSESKKEIKTLCEELPEYLGFGRLDFESVDMSNHKVIAEYRTDNDLVYEVELSNNKCRISESFHGEKISITNHVSLEKAFLHHCMSTFRTPHRRLDDISRRLSAVGNVILGISTTSPHCFFYPAGILFTVRVPLISQSKNEWRPPPFVDEVEDRVIEGAFDGVREGLMGFLRTNGDVDIQEIRFLQFTAKLAEIEIMASWFIWTGYIQSGLENAMQILCSALSVSEIPVFGVPGNCQFTHFALTESPEHESLLNDTKRNIVKALCKHASE